MPVSYTHLDVYKRQELDRETTTKFLEACEQFERIMNDSGLVRLRRLSTDEIVGTEGNTGLIERYFSLMSEGDTTLQDIELSAREMRIGDNRLCLHTLSCLLYTSFDGMGKRAIFPVLIDFKIPYNTGEQNDR